METTTGRGVADLQVSLERNGVAAATTFTSEGGHFNFGERIANSQYSVSISNTQTFIFGPAVDATNPFAQIVIPNLTSDRHLLFKGARRNTVQVSGDKSANEGDGSVELTVTRSGDTSAPAVVRYSTASGTASQASDFTTAIGAIRFAANENSKSVRVLLTEDVFVEGPETFTFTLSGPAGAQLGNLKTASVTIVDNDATPDASNPIDETRQFVRQHYHDFLGRVPDEDGLDFWARVINNCGSDAQCRDINRINVSAAFFLSIEFQQTGYLAYKASKAAYGNLPNRPVPITREQMLADLSQLGEEVIVGRGEWEQRLEQNKRDYFDAFVATDKFSALYPAEMPAEQFVDALNANAGGALSQSARDKLVNDLKANAGMRAQVLRTVAEDLDLDRAEFNRAFVMMQYFGYLQRNPDDAPDGDYSGWQFWLDHFNRHNGNYVTAELVKAFIFSREYRRRFGQ